MIYDFNSVLRSFSIPSRKLIERTTKASAMKRKRQNRCLTRQRRSVRGRAVGRRHRPAGSDRSLSSRISCSLSSSTCCRMLWYSRSFSSSCSSNLVASHAFSWPNSSHHKKKNKKKSKNELHLLVSSFILPSSMLTERCALWDSCETVELSVLTPDVATVSSWAAAGGARLWRAEFLSGPWSSSSSSSCSAGSLSEARLKWGRSSGSAQGVNAVIAGSQWGISYHDDQWSIHHNNAFQEEEEEDKDFFHGETRKTRCLFFIFLQENKRFANT